MPDLARARGERNEGDGVDSGLRGHVAAIWRDRPRLRSADVEPLRLRTFLVDEPEA
jgi:hypothetical protein